MQRSRGFSLLELLVVLVIVGLLTSLSVAWLAPGPQPATQALQRLAQASRQQAAVARHEGRVVGLRWNGQTLEWLALDPAPGAVHWQRLDRQDDSWPRDLRPNWLASSEPQLVFTPWGVQRATPVTWSWPDGRAHWRWRASGALEQSVLP